MNADLAEHLAGGLTTLCHAWAVARTDAVVFGFTDHDLDLAFDGITFKADSGMSARALQQATGLSVDNTEAFGALSDAAITEADIHAGRYDGAEVRCWRVNWNDPAQRQLQFRGTIGEMRHSGNGFTAELRGLTEALNRPMGRIYQKPCTAVLGDRACRVDLSGASHLLRLAVVSVQDGRILRLLGTGPQAAGWFQRGLLRVAAGAAQGLSGTIKSDSLDGAERLIELWEPLRAVMSTGDEVVLQSGCDKRFATCVGKFDNLVNFQGFPDLPGDGWMMVPPEQSGQMNGGSRR